MQKLLAFVVLMLALPAWADFDRADEARIFGTPLGADAIAMGNATTATWSGFSTDNPATLGVWDEKKRYVNMTGSTVRFSDASAVTTGEIGITLPITDETVIDISLGNTASGRKTTRGGDDFEISRDPYLVVMAGSRVAKDLVREGDELSLGMTFAPRIGRTTYRFFDGNETIRYDSKIFGFGAGAVYKPSEGLGIGVSYNEWRLATVAKDHAAATEETSRTHLRSLKIGVTKKVSDDLLVSIEARRFSATTVVWQLAAGAEYCVSELWCLYGGHNGAGLTAGVGRHTDDSSFTVGFAHKVAREAAEQFGRSPMLSVTYSFTF